MGAEALPPASRVYLHCHSIFTGESAQIRKLSKVTQLLIENKESISGLTHEFTIPAIASVAVQLLKDKTFKSQERAIKRFPELLGSSTAKEAKAKAEQDPAPKVVEKEVKVPLNEHGQDAVPKCENREEKGKSNDEGHNEKSTNLALKQGTDQGGCENAHTSLVDPVSQQPAYPELQPIYLPFKTQHVLLTIIQRMLEGCCFEFGHAWVPDLMKENGWREVESLELTQWTQWFPKIKEPLPAGTLRQIEGKSVAEILSAVGAIRHAAVHRVRTNAEEISAMLGAAETFAHMLYDESKVMQLEQMRTEFNQKIDEIEGSQTLMRRKLTDRLEDIARRRVELDRLEKACIEDFRATDEKHRNEAGAAIEAYLVKPQKILESFDDEAEKGESSDELESVNALDAESEDGVTLSFSDALQ